MYDELVKKVNTIQTIDTINLVTKADFNIKIKEIENKIPDHDKYITNESNKLVKQNFAERLKQANLANKIDIADFLKKTDFVERLIKINKKVTSNKTKHVETENKVNDHITSYTKLMNGLSGEVKLISTKGLTKNLRNGYSFLNDAKYIFEDGSQNYLILQPVFKYFKHLILVQTKWLWRRILKVCQMKVLNLLLHHIIILIQDLILD